MKKNVGAVDKLIRIVLRLVIVTFGIYNQSWWGLIGIVPLLTAFIRWCPAHNLPGISTDKRIEVEKLKSN